jgi:hypothetical protein
MARDPFAAAFGLGTLRRSLVDQAFDTAKKRLKRRLILGGEQGRQHGVYIHTQHCKQAQQSLGPVEHKKAIPSVRSSWAVEKDARF